MTMQCGHSGGNGVRRAGAEAPVRRREANADVIGVGWMSRESFARLAELCDDPRSFNLPYEAWLELAEAVVAGMRAQGHRVMRVELEPDRFLAWCRATGRPANGQARSAYARERAVAIAADEARAESA